MRHYDIDDSELTDDDLIGRLGAEYDEALRAYDETRIEEEIAPRFWARFGPYFNQYDMEWNNTIRLRGAGRYVLEEGHLGKVQMEWMARVLKGEIEISTHLDEETNEA